MNIVMPRNWNAKKSCGLKQTQHIPCITETIPGERTLHIGLGVWRVWRLTMCYRCTFYYTCWCWVLISNFSFTVYSIINENAFFAHIIEFTWFDLAFNFNKIIFETIFSEYYYYSCISFDSLVKSENPFSSWVAHLTANNYFIICQHFGSVSFSFGLLISPCTSTHRSLRFLFTYLQFDDLTGTTY